MLSASEIILYGAILSWAFYGILIVPYFGSQILMKTGESERFWFFILVVLNLWALLFVLVRPSFRKGLSNNDIIKLIGFASGYIILFPFIIYLMDNI